MQSHVLKYKKMGICVSRPSTLVPQFVFTDPKPKFAFTGPALNLYLPVSVSQFVFTVPGYLE